MLVEGKGIKGQKLKSFGKDELANQSVMFIESSSSLTCVGAVAAAHSRL